MEMSRVGRWVAPEVQLLLLNLFRVVDSHADIVFVESHVRLLNKSVLRWLTISGDGLFWQEGAELVHGLIVTIGGGSLVLFKFGLGKLCGSRGYGEVILLGE